MRWNASLDNQNDSRPLTLPLVFRLGNFRVSVSHHGNQHVNKEHSDDGQEKYEENLKRNSKRFFVFVKEDANGKLLENAISDLRVRLMFGIFHAFEVVTEVRE